MVATGAQDCTIKIIDVQRMHQAKSSRDGSDEAPVKPVLRTFYDHEGV
jgi:cleavage stimulation factor subunit 1